MKVGERFLGKDKGFQQKGGTRQSNRGENDQNSLCTCVKLSE